MRIVVEDIAREFNRKALFRNVSFEAAQGEVLGIAGPNGSGKSTLLKIVAGLLSPTKGKVEYHLNGAPVKPDHVHRHIGFASPYLRLFEEFSPAENIKHFARIRGMSLRDEEIASLLERVHLPTKRNDPIRAFSSGMMQRMKLIFAVMHNPAFLFLDEPITNLDDDGREIVYSIVNERREKSCMLIATNDHSDLAQCSRIIQITDFLARQG